MGVPPRYKVVATVPEGQFDDRSRAGVVADVTEAALDAEEGTRPRDTARVWVFPTEIPEGRWGGRGRIIRLADIFSRGTDATRREPSPRSASPRAGQKRRPGQNDGGAGPSSSGDPGAVT